MSHSDLEMAHDALAVGLSDESGAAATRNVKPFTIEEQRWFNQANGSRW